MKKRIRCLAFLCMAAMVLSTAACGVKDKMPETAADIIESVMKKVNNSKEMDMSMKMNMNMDMMGQSVSMVMDTNMLIFQNPIKAKINMNMNMGEIGNQAVEIYVGEQDKKYYTYTQTNNEWTKTEIAEEDLAGTLESYGSQEVEEYIKNKDNFTILETVKEEDKEYTVLEGTLPKESFEKIVGGLSLTEQLGVDLSAMENLTLDEDLKIKVWVDKETVSLKKMYMDLTGFMDQMMKAALESTLGGITDEEMEEAGMDASQAQVSIGKCDVEVTYNKFKDVEKFEIPQEALDAEITDIGDMSGILDGTENVN